MKDRLVIRIRKIVAVLLTAMLAVSLSGCVKNEFDIRFNLPGDVSGSYRVVYYARDKRGGVTIETGIGLAQGKGELKGMTRLPVIIFLFEGNAQVPAAVFYAERGDKLTVSGDDKNPYKWSCKGNKLAEQLSDWRLAHAEVLARRDVVQINKAVAEEVESHPSERLSGLLLGLYYDRREDDTDAPYRKLRGMLKGDAADEEMAALLARADMSGASGNAPEVAKLPSEMVLQTASTGCDTVYLAKGRPSLLYFRANMPSDDIEEMKVVKQLCGEFKDSAARNIVELYLTCDSLTWTSALRRDTLKGAVRARLPREYAEPYVMALGLGKAPWYIVADGKGKILYSGDSAEKAGGRFRAEAGKKRGGNETGKVMAAKPDDAKTAAGKGTGSKK